MGNYASCVLNINQSKGVKVIFPSGEVKIFKQPTNAAELMLEIPNYFVVNSTSLQIGRRFSPLNADDDLDVGNIYVLFPMKRVNSFVVASDMGQVFLAAKRGASKVRVVPACFGEESDEGSPAREDDAREMGVGLPVFQHRRSACRSKKPVLETIVEEPVWLR